ncbi:MAG: hypothetical protein DMG13_27340 [Acidobacteria bacterium]|nr:MAG: hypothetical protein DMG13_27340 [Acidobacteriota bacterium]
MARKRGKRPPYDRVLIVCEGKKTEPLYLNDIRRQNHVSSAHISVMHSDYGTEPRQVVDFAVDTFKKTKEYDRVFAVFDRDEHQTYHDALTRAAALNGTLKNDERKSVPFIAVRIRCRPRQLSSKHSRHAYLVIERRSEIGMAPNFTPRDRGTRTEDRRPRECRPYFVEPLSGLAA